MRLVAAALVATLTLPVAASAGTVGRYVLENAWPSAYKSAEAIEGYVFVGKVRSALDVLWFEVSDDPEFGPVVALEVSDGGVFRQSIGIGELEPSDDGVSRESIGVGELEPSDDGVSRESIGVGELLDLELTAYGLPTRTGTEYRQYKFSGCSVKSWSDSGSPDRPAEFIVLTFQHKSTETR